MTGRTISHFRVLDKLGGGGMGVVYLGDDLELKRKVALKFLPPHLSADHEANQRFVQEAQAASALNHPNVCTIYEIGHTDEGQTFIAMAHYEGETLKEKLERGPLPTEEAADIARQVAEGLAAAHEQGIIHRDIKPANILITKRGRAVILDFGLAKLTGSLDLTKSGSTLGTAHYMSPEQIRNEEVDHRTDTWSLGVVLYEMLAGKKPFTGDYEHAISYAILNEEPGTLPDIPGELLGLVQRMLSKAPVVRPFEVGEAASTLAAFGPGTTRRSEMSGKDATSASARGRTPWMVISGVIAAILIGAFFLIPRLSSDNGADEPMVLEGLVVMPFTVRGDESLEYLSEGMVDLLSLALDGVGGRRAVDARLIFGEIERSGTNTNDLVAVRSLVEKLGAKDFILGTVMRVGPHVRFSATQYDAEGNAVVQVDEEVEEGNDDPMPAIDRLAQRLMASYVEEVDEGRLRVTAMTTSSLPALKAYLEGEQEMRDGRYVDARMAFEQSVDLDSTFALGWYRLGTAWGWTFRWDLNRSFVLKASAMADGLPDRFQTLLAAETAMFRGHGPEAERLYRSLTREYPADAYAWYSLGEYYIHQGPTYGVSLFLAKEPFERAFALDPENTEALQHLIDIAVDESRFETVDSLIGQSHPEWDYRESYELELALFMAAVPHHLDSLIHRASNSRWGSSLALVTRAKGKLGPFLADNRYLEIGERIFGLRMVNADLSVGGRRWARTAYTLRHLIRTGRWSEVRENMYISPNPERPDHELEALWIIAVSPLGAVLEGELGDLRQRVENEYPADPDGWEGLRQNQGPVFRAFMIGMLSARMDDWSEVERQAVFLEQFAAADESGFAAGFATTLRAFLATSMADDSRAYDLASEVILPVTGPHGNPFYGRAYDRHLRAVLLMKEKRYQEAIALWGSLAESHELWQVPSYLNRAQCYEAMGNTDRAIALYQLFADLWKDADPELQPMVDEARAGLERLLENQIREPS